MKYMLIMSTEKKNWDTFASWAKEDLRAHIDFMKTFTKKLSDRGELVAAEGLDVPANAKVVRARKGGSPSIDGVFAETKEFLAGYWIVEVNSPERAYAIAAEASAAPGPGGEITMPIEIRQVMSGPPEI